MSFPLRIRDRGVFFRWHLELELGLCLSIAGRMEGIGRAGASRVLALLASLGYACWRGRTGSAGPCEKMEKWEGKEDAGLAELSF
jgi:hypothetical protein